MLQNIDDYMKMDNSLTLDEMREIHAAMLNEIGSDPDSLDLYHDLCKAAVRYANMRARCNTMSLDEKSAEDHNRTGSHNALIDQFNMLARWIRKQGSPAAWRDALGYVDEDPTLRRRIGDMGCYLAFVAALLER